jgi:integrase
MDKLKKTKTNEERKVNLYPEIKEQLLELLAANPHKIADPFVFYFLYEDQPFDGKLLLNGLYEACEAAGIPYKERGICFHSHRHFWATLMSPHIEKDKLCQLTGHKTKAIFDSYADHEVAENLEEVGKLGAEVFGKILQFKKAV